MNEGGAGKRPALITVICCLGFIGAAFSALNLFTALAGPSRSPFHAYYFGVTAAGLAGLIGMWRMRRWGVLLYALTAAANASCCGACGASRRRAFWPGLRSPPRS